jgi:hypothetical protein
MNLWRISCVLDLFMNMKPLESHAEGPVATKCKYYNKQEGKHQNVLRGQ